MGELQHGTYDNECEGLTLEEVNGFYDFSEEGESQFGDEDPDQSDEEQEEDSGEESEVGMELDEPGLGDIIDPDQDFDMEVCHSSIC